jgi:hypothetical protein
LASDGAKVAARPSAARKQKVKSINRSKVVTAKIFKEPPTPPDLVRLSLDENEGGGQAMPN